MKAHWNYLVYLLRHKYFVFLECLKLGVPIWIAILHDWDKFLPDEWFGYAHYIYAPDGTKYVRQSKDFRYLPTNSEAFDRAYFLHMKRNKHHWQWWIVAHENGLHMEPMSDLYRREMLADWRGAGRALGKPDTLAWYSANAKYIQLHPDTRCWIEQQLGILPQPLTPTAT
jgi:hypothetical protein